MNIKLDFEQVWRLYYHTINLYISKHIVNWQDVEDLSNDIFITAYDHYENYDPDRASVFTWLYNITRNRLKNYYRDRKEMISINGKDEPVDIPSHEDIEQNALLEERVARLREALEQLPFNQRTAIELKYFYALSGEEIASKMNITSNHVRVIVNRGKKRLRELMSDFIEG